MLGAARRDTAMTPLLHFVRLAYGFRFGLWLLAAVAYFTLQPAGAWASGGTRAVGPCLGRLCVLIPLTFGAWVLSNFLVTGRALPRGSGEADMVRVLAVASLLAALALAWITFGARNNPANALLWFVAFDVLALTALLVLG